MILSRGLQDDLLWGLLAVCWFAFALWYRGHTAWGWVWMITTAVLFVGSVLALAKESRLPARLGLLTVLAMMLLGMMLPVQ